MKIERILGNFKKTALGINAVQNEYTDKEILKRYSKKVMMEKIKNIKNDKIKSDSIDKMLKNTKQKYKNCWDWELINLDK